MLATLNPARCHLGFSIANILGENNADSQRRDDRLKTESHHFSIFRPETTTGSQFEANTELEPGHVKKRLFVEVDTESVCERAEQRTPDVTDIQTSSSDSSPESRTSPSSDAVTEDVGEEDSNRNKKKKSRTSFTTEQLTTLERQYRTQRYLPALERKLMAKKIGMGEQQVKTWFQNRRMKEKRQVKENIYDSPSPYVMPPYMPYPCSMATHTINTMPVMPVLHPSVNHLSPFVPTSGHYSPLAPHVPLPGTHLPLPFLRTVPYH